jgi:hypothetical protein
MWRTASLSDPSARSRSNIDTHERHRPRWRRPAIAVGLVVALTGVGAGAAPAFAAPEHQGVIEWGADNRPLPIPAAAESNVVAASVGKTSTTHALALKTDGSVIGWGANDNGKATPPLEAQSDVLAISAGSTHSLALKSDGSVIGWGSNSSGQTTIPAAAQSGVVSIAAGFSNSFAVKADGSVVAWGAPSLITSPPAGLSGVTAVGVAIGWAVALKSDGTVVAWGSPGFPAPPAGLSGVVAIATGLDHTLALKSDGSVVGWGNNIGNQIQPPPEASSGVVAVAAGTAHSLALKSDGSVIGWGSGVAAQPIPEAGSGVVAIAAGSDTSLAVKDLSVAPTITGTPPSGAVGEPYSFTYDVTGAPAPTVTLLAGTSLPPGLALSAAGVISGTPTTAGTFSFTVEASNGVNPTALLESTITVQAVAKPKADVSVAITGPATAKKGTPVTYQVAVTNAGPQTSVNVGATILVSPAFTIQTIPAGATKVGQLVTFPTAEYTSGQQRQFAITLVPKANSGTALLAAAAGSLVTPDPKLVNNAALKSVKLTK